MATKIAVQNPNAPDLAAMFPWGLRVRDFQELFFVTGHADVKPSGGAHRGIHALVVPGWLVEVEMMAALESWRAAVFVVRRVGNVVSAKAHSKLERGTRGAG